MDEDFIDLVFCFSTVFTALILNFAVLHYFLICVMRWVGWRVGGMDGWTDGRTNGRAVGAHVSSWLTILTIYIIFCIKKYRIFIQHNTCAKDSDLMQMSVRPVGEWLYYYMQLTTTCSLHYTFTTYLLSLTTNKTGIWSKSIKISWHSEIRPVPNYLTWSFLS